ncbi:hypothetical protein ACFV0T_09320 [Streptomyces sp. NPDC059582]|uniref:hypothetical protein n=1 Tax=Streptomyces sp. NPDC059582 TaxID=3346875 RepID=UPI0036C40606
MSHEGTPPPPPPLLPPPPPPPGYTPPFGFPPPQPPKKPRTALIATAAAVAAAVVATALTAIVTGGSDGEAEAAPTVTVTETASAQDTDTAADPDSDPSADPSDGDSYALDDTITYDGDIDVSLTKFSRAVSSEYASPEKTPYAKFTIKIVNNSGKTFDATAMTVNCAYGDEGREGESIYDDGLDGLPDTSILTGRSLSIPWGCELPKAESFLQVEVAPDFDSETAIFTGDVK